MKITERIKMIKIFMEDIKAYTINAYTYLINEDYNKRKVVVEKLLGRVPDGCDEVVHLLNEIEEIYIKEVKNE